MAKLSLHDQFLANALIHVVSRFGYDATFDTVVAGIADTLPKCGRPSPEMSAVVDAAEALVAAAALPAGKPRTDALFLSIMDARSAVRDFSKWRMLLVLGAIEVADAKADTGRAA